MQAIHDDTLLLQMCAEFWVQKERIDAAPDDVDDDAFQNMMEGWNGLRDEIEGTRPKSIHGLAAKARVCEFALAANHGDKNSGLDSNQIFTMAVLRDCALLAQAAAPA